MNLWLIFLTGLSVGGLTCLAVQGGLLASTIAAREEEDLDKGDSRKHSLVPTISFLVGKLIAYAVLGFLLGSFGQVLQISGWAQTIMQFLAGSYMIAVALNLLDVHPIFRYVIIQPPRFITKAIRNWSKSKQNLRSGGLNDFFAPSLLGVMTIFIPCGTTLAMEALAISSGNPLSGSLIMAVFTLGTTPLFLGVGFLTTFLGDIYKRRFFKIAGIIVFYLGINSLNGSLVASGSPVTLQKIAELIPIEIDLNGGEGEYPNVKVISGVQNIDIAVFPTSYNPNYIKVRTGIPVRLNLEAKGGLGCTSFFRIPKYGINKRLTQGVPEAVEFTPKSAGRIVFTCSMGMYSGTIEAI